MLETFSSWLASSSEGVWALFSPVFLGIRGSEGDENGRRGGVPDLMLFLEEIPGPSTSLVYG